MINRINLYRLANDVSNLNLKQAAEEKQIILSEMQNEETLVVILRLHLYAEKELESVLKSIFVNSQKYIGENYTFINKLDLIYNLGYMEKTLYDAVLKLNWVRNKLAHNLDYEKNTDIYSILKDGLSNNILKEHKLDVDRHVLIHKDIDNEKKIRILLVNVWLQLKIFSSSMLLKKLDYANRLESQVKDEVANNTSEL